MDERLDANRKLWNALAAAHVGSDFYDVEGFRQGRTSLLPVEREEVGDVAGKSLLHLQCHFGLDTLSWERLGAIVTGVDFSENAIAFARQLTKDMGMNARFVCADIYHLQDVLDTKFDIVFTSYGALVWLPDVQKWADIVAPFLKPGGVFYIAEIHPILVMFYDEDNRGDSSGLQVRGSYFPRGTYRYDGGHDYASDYTHEITSYEWQHPVAEVVTSLANARLRIDFLHEFPACCFQALPEMKKAMTACGGWKEIRYRSSTPSRRSSRRPDCIAYDSIDTRRARLVQSTRQA